MVNFYEINFMKGIVILVKVEKRSCSISWKVWSLVERWMWNWMIWIFLESALQFPSACYIPRLLMGTYYFFSYHSDYQCDMTSKLRFQPYSRVANNCTPQLLIFRFFSTQDIFIPNSPIINFQSFLLHFWV